jgi:aryl-alcohol dehydrogenase-like predicted oxidoreductase
MMEKMEYVPLKNTDLVVSRIALGTRDYGSGIPEDVSDELLSAYYDIGGTFFDTAHIYGRLAPGDRSLSEMMIGKWMKNHHINRSSVVLSSKGCSNVTGIRGYHRMRPEFLKADFEESLRNLGTDYLDFYFLHRDDDTQPVEPIMDALNDYVRKGKLRYFGCSNWSMDRIRQAQEYAKASGRMGFAATQLMYSMALPNLTSVEAVTQRFLTDRMMKFLVDMDMPFFAYSSQARGYFHLVFTKEFRMDSRIDRTVKFYDHTENQIRALRAQQLCEETGMTMSDVVLGYVMSQPIQGIPIVQPDTAEQFEMAFHSVRAHLAPEQIRFILAS